jgi:hypothetical protein
MLVLQLVHEKYFKNTLDFTSVSFIKYWCRTKRINVVVAITSIVQYVNLVHSKGKKYSTNVQQATEQNRSRWITFGGHEASPYYTTQWEQSTLKERGWKWCHFFASGTPRAPIDCDLRYSDRQISQMLVRQWYLTALTHAPISSNHTTCWSKKRHAG